MSKTLRKINEQLGLTKSESVVFWFLILTFVAGLFVKLLTGDVRNLKKQQQRFDYSVYDSEFEKLSKNVQLEVESQNTTTQLSDNTETPSFKININTATKEELMKLPGIGEKTAESIIKHRQIYGNFKRVEDLMNVKGIGQKKFERIRKYLTIN